MEGSECVEEYIIQYEGRSVSTGGALSVVINDTIFCQQPNITFSVTAVLMDGSMINGSELDFTLKGKSKQSYPNVTSDNGSRVIGVHKDFPLIVLLVPRIFQLVSLMSVPSSYMYELLFAR